MQKDKSRFTAAGGQYLGVDAPTTEQKKDAKKTAAYLRSLKDDEKSCNVVISH
ncbi:MAG: hypothetical protein WC626_07430 [Methanoregula sp.]